MRRFYFSYTEHGSQSSFYRGSHFVMLQISSREKERWLYLKKDPSTNRNTWQQGEPPAEPFLSRARQYTRQNADGVETNSADWTDLDQSPPSVQLNSYQLIHSPGLHSGYVEVPKSN